MDERKGSGKDKPRSPDEHDRTGTGSPRSADDHTPGEGAFAGGDEEAAVTAGMRSTTHPAFSDEVTINRSGSGGSGGPVEGEEGSEGSTGQSMSELLAGEDDAEDRTT